METGGTKAFGEKPLTVTTSSTTNPMWTGLALNLGLTKWLTVAKIIVVSVITDHHQKDMG
jgi:hypothetical protein